MLKFKKIMYVFNKAILFSKYFEKTKNEAYIK